MKILFLSDNFPPEVNAAASRVYERAVYWAKWGHDITVITCAPNFPIGKVYPGYKNKWYQTEMMDGIKVVRVKTFIAKNQGFALRVLDFMSYMFMATLSGLFLKKPDVIISTSPQFFTAVGGHVLAKLKRTPFVFEIGDLWPESIRAVGALQNEKLYKAIESVELHLYRKSKRIIAQTPSFKDNLVKRHIPADKIDVIMNGVDLARYQPQPKSEQWLKQFNLNVNDFVVAYVGTHGMAHDLHTILQAAQLLQNKPSIKFLFVGEGAAKQSLMDYKEEQKLANVSFNSAVKKADMPAVWSVCDVILIPLKNDPTFSTVVPSKIYESMAMAKVIILMAPEGEASKIIVKNHCGEWIEPANPQLLSNTILNLYANKELMQQLSESAQSASKQFSRENQARLVLDTANKTQN